MVRRAIEIEGTDVVMELSKVTMIRQIGFTGIHIDRLKDGTYRMIYGEALIPDIQKVQGFKIIREN